MRKLFVIAVAVALLVGIIVIPIFAARKAAEKVTGTVGGPPRGWYAEFDAHEAFGHRPAKGAMRRWSDVVGRVTYFDVKYVRVEGNTAWFAAVCTYDSSTTDNREGKWAFVKVFDGGTPGTTGDKIGWDWNSVNETDAESRVEAMDTPDNGPWSITDGNLVVHTY